MVEISDEQVEAACKGYWPDHWPQHFADADTASIRRHMRAALEAALSPGVPKVKALVWQSFDSAHEYGRGVWDANYPWGTFTIMDCIQQYKGENRYYARGLRTANNTFSTLEAAQAAVYEEYAERILSALVPTAPTSGDGR